MVHKNAKVFFGFTRSGSTGPPNPLEKKKMKRRVAQHVKSESA
jgi:hypothetical protein